MHVNRLQILCGRAKCRRRAHQVSMRSAGTVSGPLLSISTPPSQQNRFAAVHLLTGQSLYFVVEVSVKLRSTNEKKKIRKTRERRRCIYFLNTLFTAGKYYYVREFRLRSWLRCLYIYIYIYFTRVMRPSYHIP